MVFVKTYDIYYKMDKICWNNRSPANIILHVILGRFSRYTIVDTVRYYYFNQN